MTVGNSQAGADGVARLNGVNGHRVEPVVLVRPLGATTWLATSDGDEVTARPAPGERPPTGDPRAVTPADDHLVPFLGLARVDDVLGDTPWLLSGYVAGADLERLLSLTTLTPGQSAAIATEVYEGLSALHAGGVGHGHLGTRSVLVGADGVVRLTDWAAGTWAPDASGALQQHDLDCARRVVTALARNADRPVVHRRPREADLLACLERIGAREPTAPAADTVATLRGALRAATDVVEARRDVHAELAALVAAVMQRSPDPTPRADRAPARARRQQQSQQQPARPLPVTSLSAADWRKPPRSRRAWAVVAVAAVIAGALVLLRSPASSLLDRLTHRHQAQGTTAAQAAGTGGARVSKPSTSHRPTPRAVPLLAPAAAGTVSGVSLRPLAPCRAGRSCPVRITVTVAPSDSLQRVTWELVYVNRCTGKRTAKPGGVLIAQPGWTSAYTTRTLKMPTARAQAVVAVTTSPAKAASAPVLVPTTARSC